MSGSQVPHPFYAMERDLVYPGMKKYWVGVAFKKGDMHNFEDNVVMLTTGGNYVHCEIIVGDETQGKAFTSYRGVGGFVHTQYCAHLPPEWEMFYFPLQEIAKPTTYARETAQCGIRYNLMGQWRCLLQMKNARELDCMKPQEWRNGVFCSQMVLLFLRRLVLSGLILAQNKCTAQIRTFPSMTCTPTILRQMLCDGFLRAF